MKYMYHLTTEESWEHIREEGLRPRCGRNSYPVSYTHLTLPTNSRV